MSSKFFKNLKGALEEAVAHKEGRLDLHAEYIEIPESPAPYKAKDIKKSKK